MKKVLYILLLSFLHSSILFGQNEDVIPIKKVPNLNGHVFPSFGQFKSSFINTNLGVVIGVGKTSELQLPGLTIGETELFSFKGEILFADVNINYKQRFTPRLSLYISLHVAGRIGTDISTMLVDGVNSISGGEIGWLINIIKKEKFNLSSSIDVSKSTGNFINVSEYLEELLNNNPYPSIYKKTPAMGVGIGLQGAYAFSPTFGAQFHSEFTYGESFVRNKTRTYFTMGIAGDCDFNPKYNVPINFGFGYNISSSPEVVLHDGGVSNLFFGKITYSGSTDFELGAQFSYYDVEIKSSVSKPYVSKIVLVLQFYF